MSGGPALDPAIGLALRVSFALLLALSAAHKLRDPDAFRASLEGYAILPTAIMRPAAASIPVAEILIAMGLLVASGPAPWLATAGLLCLYAFAIAINLRRGRVHIDCGCGGPAGRQPIGPALLVRNLLLISIALLGALPSGGRPLAWMDAATVLGAGLALLLLYQASELALRNQALLESTRRSG